MTLIILNILIWLGPLLFSLRSGRLNTLHPQFILPIFMIYFILNSHIQDQTNWMDEGNRAIIIGIVKLLPGLDPINFSFKKALIVSLLSGIFFHLGTLVFNKSIYKSNDEHILLNKKKIINRNTNFFLLIAIFIASIVWMPNYFIPNAGHGTFWTYPLSLSVCFLPIAVYQINKIFSVVVLLIALFVAYFILASKAAFAYILMPIFFYYVFFNINFFKIFYKKSYLKNFFISICILIIVVSSFFIGNKYGELNIKKLFRRDYAFEIFAILVESKDAGLIKHEKSWITNEVLQFLPSAIYKNKSINHVNPSKRVAQELFPETAQYRPQTYWNRHFLFAGYYDFGTLGSIIGAFLCGLFFSYSWKLTKEKVIKYEAQWPIFVYLPLPSLGAYFLAVGGFAYGTICFGISSLILYLIFLSTRIRLN